MATCAVCRTEVPAHSGACPSCGSVGGLSDDDLPTGAGVPSTPPASRPSIGADRLEPGALLADRYRIVALLGRGGMGEVYRADDLTLGQPVALKFLPAAIDNDPRRLERFLAEVRIARQVSHPNVCRVYDVGSVSGRHFLSMEYIDGEDLASLLRRIGRLPSDKAIEIARQLCAGLAAAHDRGILHRDLKPANVMLDGRGRVRLTDFGLAEAVGTGSDPAQLAGTPAYMAPEQFAAAAASVQSDIYALGLVLYEIFSGRRAFDGTVISELRRLHEESHPASLITTVRDIDPAVERVIFRCLEKDPRNRPVSAIAVAAALPGGDPLAAALAAGETPSPDMVAAAGKEGGLRPAIAVCALAAVVVGLAFTTYLATRTSALTRTPLEYSPEVLGVKAREMLGRLGFVDRPVDTADGLAWDSGALDYLEKQDHTARRWASLATGHFPFRFWVRGSPVYLVPQTFGGGQLVGGVLVGRTDPPLTVAGMTEVVLDPRGRLLELRVAPPQTDRAADKAAQTVDWTRVLVETGLDPATIQPATPLWLPQFFADTRAAWTGTYPDLKDTPVRVEAAAYAGRPVSVQVVPPWRAPNNPAAGAGDGANVLAAILLTALIVGGSVLAWRNLTLGRGDRRGAGRLALVTAGAFMVSWLLEGHHVPAADEVELFMKALSWSLFAGGLVWVLYLGLEPQVRRRWPHTLITWNRLLAGRFTDPLVGRDVLIGAAVGIALSLAAYGQAFARDWWAGVPQQPDARLLAPLLGPGRMLSALLFHAFNATLSVLVIFFLLFVFRLVFRRDWLAAAGFLLVNVAQVVASSSNPVVDGIINTAVDVVLVVVLLRSGLVAFGIAVLFLTVTMSYPLSIDFGTWYGNASIGPLLALVAIAAYGFRTSLAGTSLLGSALDG